MKILICLMAVSFNLFAKKSDQSQDSIESTVLQNLDSETFIETDPYSTTQDKHRLAMSYHFSYDYHDVSKVQSLNFNYLNKIEQSLQNLWWGLQYKRVLAKYNAVASKRISEEEGFISIARGEKIQTFDIVGLGVGYNFKVLKESFDFDRVFETISFYTNYVKHVDATDTRQYSGYGFNTDYSIHYRSGESFFYGFNLSYQWIFTQLDQSDTTLKNSSLAFGWTDLGVELGYFF